MSYVKPDQVVESMVQAGAKKAGLPFRDLLIRSILAGVVISYAATLSMTATVQTGIGLVGALVFPVGLVMIVLLGMELVTGNFALVPLAVYEKKASSTQMLVNWAWVFIGNMIGCLFYALLYFISFRFSYDQSVIEQVIKTAEAKTLAYEALGSQGFAVAFVKGILCNWMVALGVVMAMTSESVIGKIVAMWLPIFIFAAQGYEHAVVNLFVIPAGMMFGADVTMSDWWLWNQIPVTLGNLVGAAFFTGFALYATHKTRNVKKLTIVGKTGTE
ncbi:formate/nitrite transporter family protein [Domibacillus epiphyticus]|uniref:Formate transporter n=1 Tax=Domibacillus epiphyticus TaxID=1714355 RepID=A0A1V2AB44_9BACI|nr:formate/nitrite transporter family protein [Domibacillus epiphyticus]OMP68218.1 formate transporter [Domibacillus epiphyticus]